MSEIKNFFSPEASESWIFSLGFILIAALIIQSVCKWILKKEALKDLPTKFPWHKALATSVSRPLFFFIWIIAIIEVVAVLSKTIGFDLHAETNFLRNISFLILATWSCVRFLTETQKHFGREAISGGEMAEKSSAISFGCRIAKVLVYFGALIMMIHASGFNVSGLLTIGGVGGIVLGLAAKDVLSNLFSGVMLHLDKPFAVGDWISSTEKDIEGTVEDIGWRTTRIRKFATPPLYVPNALFAQITIQNPSRMENRRIYELVGVRYEDLNVIKDVVSDITDYLSKNPNVDQSKSITVNFTKLSPSSLDILVYCFTNTKEFAEFQKIRQDVLINVLEVIQKNGASCAFPTSTIHLETEDSQQ